MTTASGLPPTTTSSRIPIKRLSLTLPPPVLTNYGQLAEGLSFMSRMVHGRHPIPYILPAAKMTLFMVLTLSRRPMCGPWCSKVRRPLEPPPVCQVSSSTLTVTPGGALHLTAARCRHRQLRLVSPVQVGGTLTYR